MVVQYKCVARERKQKGNAKKKTSLLFNLAVKQSDSVVCHHAKENLRISLSLIEMPAECGYVDTYRKFGVANRLPPPDLNSLGQTSTRK